MRLLRYGASPARVMLLNAAVLLAAIGVGCVSGFASRGPDVPTRPEHTRAVSADFLEDVAVIFEGNVRVVATLLLGACTGSVLTVIVLLWNGYQLGFGLAVLSSSAFDDVVLLMKYVPLEFAAFGLASAAAMSLSTSIAMVLLHGTPMRLRAPLGMTGASLLMLLAAAMVEASVKAEIAR